MRLRLSIKNLASLSALRQLYVHTYLGRANDAKIASSPRRKHVHIRNKSAYKQSHHKLLLSLMMVSKNKRQNKERRTWTEFFTTILSIILFKPQYINTSRIQEYTPSLKAWEPDRTTPKQTNKTNGTLLLLHNNSTIAVHTHILQQLCKLILQKRDNTSHSPSKSQQHSPSQTKTPKEVSQY